MRAAGGSLSTFLDTNIRAWYADLFTWTPASGGPYYWTNWTSDLYVGGHTFTAAGTGTVPLIEANGYKSSVGTNIETTTITLQCGSGAQFGGVRLPMAAAGGMFDGCGLLVERLFMGSPGDVSLGTIHVFQGIVGDAEPSSSVVTLTVESGMAALNQVIPRTFIQAPCNNILFDSVCAAGGLTKASKTVTGTCAAGATALVVPTSRTADGDGWFELGVITLTSGACAGVSRGVVKSLNASGAMTLDRPLPAIPANGDTFSVYPGCDKARNGGCTKFANTAQFRGFPFAPSQGTTYDPVIRTGTAKGGKGGGSTYNWRSMSSSSAVGTGGYGTVLPIVYGLQRVKGSLIYLAPPSKRPTVQTLAAQIMALCQGPITSVTKAWRNSSAGTLAAMFDNAAGAAASVSGANTQSPWSWVTSNDPTEALSYPGVAQAAFVQTPYTPQDVDSRSFEVAGLLYNGLGGLGDAHPADVIADVLTASYAAAQPYSVVTDLGQDGTAASSFRRYATADNFGVSLLLDQQRPAKDVLQELLDSTNSDVVWSDGAFKILPYADIVTVGNAVTYTPVTTPQYALGPDDFFVEGNEDPITATRGPSVDLSNTYPVEYLERSPITWRPSTAVVSTTPDQVVNAGNLYQCITSGTTASSGGPTGKTADITDGTAHWKYLQIYDPAAAYATSTVESPDPVDVALNKIKRASPISAHAICVRDSAVKLSRLWARRMLYARTVYRFRLPYRFCRLEPMDLVSLTEPTFGLVNQVVRIQSIMEQIVNGAPVYEIEAVEWPVGFCQAPAHLTGSNESANYQPPWGANMAMGTTGGLVAAALSSWVVGAIPSGAWTSVVEMDSGSAYPGRLVAIGGTNVSPLVAYSTTQGRTWTAGTMPAGSWWRSICAGGPAGLVAVGANGVNAIAATSSNGGATWTTRTPGGVGQLETVRWNGSMYVAVGGPGIGSWSTDGVTWTSVTLPGGVTMNNYDGLDWSPSLSLWLAVGYPGISATSPDGNAWTSRGIDSGSFPHLRSVAWSPTLGVFSITASSEGVAYTSSDGIAWLKHPIGGGLSLMEVTWGRGVFVATAWNVSTHDSVAYSFDGISWSILDTTMNSNLNGIAWINGPTGSAGRFIVVGDTYGVSTDPRCAVSGQIPY